MGRYRSFYGGKNTGIGIGIFFLVIVFFPIVGGFFGFLNWFIEHIVWFIVLAVILFFVKVGLDVWLQEEEGDE
jgi:hypothetical protein